jgi:hypothetical protein
MRTSRAIVAAIAMLPLCAAPAVAHERDRDGEQVGR